MALFSSSVCCDVINMKKGFIILAVLVLALRADQEHEGHGARSPHERFEDEHYKDGKHHEDMDHQAIIGSKKEAEEFDHLSPEESKKRLRILAEKMDRNKDGFVDKAELQAWIHESLKKLDAEEVDERLKEMDDDSDGLLSWDEYKKDAFGDEEEKGEIDEDDKRLLEEDARYFKAADKNGDGKLNKMEFGGFQNPEHHPHMHDTLVEITLKEKDKDGDGKIDLEEFLGDISDKPDSEWYGVEKERFKKDYDTDGNGLLDREEMKKWLVPDIDQTAREETDHLFEEADVNKDDKLSYDEITNEHQLFVGSEATNYGEHLNRVEL